MNKYKKIMTKDEEIKEQVAENLVQRTYGVELYFESDCCEIPVDLLLKNLRRQMGNVDIIGGKENSKLIFFNDNMVEFTDGKVPSQIAMFKNSGKPEIEKMEMAFNQSWEFSNAKEVVTNCNSSILVTDMMSSGLDYKDRMKEFQTTLSTLLELVDCKAVYWQPSQQFIRPESIIENKPESEEYSPIHGIANVRLFNISGSNNELLMDTLGLSVLGLFDFEIVFSNLSENEVANLLYTYARYIFENGNVIKDGHTIQGVGSNSKLQCRLDESLTSPNRFVINLEVK